MNWTDKKQALEAVRQDGLALQHVPVELRADRDVVLAAVRRRGWALQYASAEFRADREVVLAAVTQDGLALQYVSAELWADRDVVLAAVRDYGLALQCASPRLWLGEAFWSKAVEQRLFAEIPYRGEPDPVVLAAVGRDPAVYDQLDAGHKADITVRLLARKG
jgi:hypothetical protein